MQEVVISHINAKTVDGTMSHKVTRLENGQYRAEVVFTDNNGQLVAAKCSMRTVDNFRQLLIGG